MSTRRSPGYRLQTVLDTRRRTKRQAALQLQICRERLSETRATLAALEVDLLTCQSEQRQIHDTMLRAAAQGLAAKRLLFFRSQLADLRKRTQELAIQIDRQKQLVLAAERIVDRAFQMFFEADRELRVSERHKELWALNLCKEENRREQKANDEISLIMRHRAKPAGA